MRYFVRFFPHCFGFQRAVIVLIANSRVLTTTNRYRRILFAIIPDVYNTPLETKEYVEKFLKLLDYLRKRTEGGDEDIDIEIRNREGLKGEDEGVSTTGYKTDNKRTMKHYVVPLADLKRHGRYEWMILAMSSFFDPGRVFRIGYHWLVGSASRVESEVKGLSRRCAQFGLRLQQFPEYVGRASEAVRTPRRGEIRSFDFLFVVCRFLGDLQNRSKWR